MSSRIAAAPFISGRSVPICFRAWRASSRTGETSVCQAERDGCRGAAFDVLDLVDAGANGDHPPIWSHITFFAGNLTSAFPFRYPTGGTRPATINGLFRTPHPKATFLGSFNWGGSHGTLILAPAFPDGGQQGDRLIFRWRENGVSYALGLHGWEPLADAVATLRTMVSSTE